MHNGYFVKSFLKIYQMLTLEYDYQQKISTALLQKYLYHTLPKALYPFNPSDSHSEPSFLLKVIRSVLNKLEVKLKMLQLLWKPDVKGFLIKDQKRDLFFPFFHPFKIIMLNKNYVHLALQQKQAR